MLTDIFSGSSFAIFAAGSGALASKLASDADLLVLLILRSFHRAPSISDWFAQLARWRHWTESLTKDGMCSFSNALLIGRAFPAGAPLRAAL
jgi:hypothetical protein